MKMNLKFEAYFDFLILLFLNSLSVLSFDDANEDISETEFMLWWMVLVARLRIVDYLRFSENSQQLLAVTYFRKKGLIVNTAFDWVLNTPLQ